MFWNQMESERKNGKWITKEQCGKWTVVKTF